MGRRCSPLAIIFVAGRKAVCYDQISALFQICNALWLESSAGKRTLNAIESDYFTDRQRAIRLSCASCLKCVCR
jgi:hypothetical protein